MIFKHIIELNHGLDHCLGCNMLTGTWCALFKTILAWDKIQNTPYRYGQCFITESDSRTNP
jgi:hypothetical protein